MLPVALNTGMSKGEWERMKRRASYILKVVNWAVYLMVGAYAIASIVTGNMLIRYLNTLITALPTAVFVYSLCKI